MSADDILIGSRFYVLYRDRFFFDLLAREFVDFSRAELFFEVEVASSYVKSNPGAIVLTYDPDEYDPKFQFRTLDGKVFDVLKSSPTNAPKESTMAVNTNQQLVDEHGNPLSKAGVQGRLSQRATQRAAASSKPTNRSRFQAKTGDRNTDRNHPEFDNFDSKEGKPGGSIMSLGGDVMVKIKDVLLDKNLSTSLGIFSAIAATTASAIGYVAAFSPYLIQSVTIAGIPAAWFSPITIGVPMIAAIIVQLSEVQPILPKIFPKEADKLAYKLGTTKFVQVREDDNTPTLLRPVKLWARNAAANNQRSAEWIRWGLYGFEFFMSMSLFGTSLFSGGVLAIAVLFLIAYGVIGCELSLRYAASEEQKRLTHRESQKYNLLKQTHRREAEARIK